MSKIHGAMMLWPTAALGDFIVTYPIMRHYALISKQIYLPLTLTNKTLVNICNTLFSDLNNIELIEHLDTHNYDILSKSFNASYITAAHLYNINYGGVPSRPLWEEQWYTWFELPYSLRYRGFKIPDDNIRSKELYSKLVNNENYILVHDEILGARQKIYLDLKNWRSPEDQIIFDTYQKIFIDPSLSDNLLDYVDLIKNAKEIHCTPSCIHQLVESINDKTNAKLYYHNIRKDALMRVNNRWNNYKWQFINYDVKF